MQNKENLEELKYFILWDIHYNSESYKVELKENGVEYIPAQYSPGFRDGYTTLPIGQSFKKGLLILDGKTIAIIDEKKVISIDFNDRYDALIRFIFTALDIELHRFGSSWIGYPSPDQVPSPMVPPSYSNKTLGDGSTSNSSGSTSSPFYQGTVSYGFDIGATGTTTISTGSWATNISTTTITYPGGYGGTSGTLSITGFSDNSWMAAPEVKTRNTRTIPKNPILAEAQRSGISQVKLELNKKGNRK